LQAFEYASTNCFIAFACAVEPLAEMSCLPPQSTLDPLAYARAEWGLPHPETTSAAAASKLTAAAGRLRFTLIASSGTTDGETALGGGRSLAMRRCSWRR
jgi:hypothetical protein